MFGQTRRKDHRLTKELKDWKISKSKQEIFIKYGWLPGNDPEWWSATTTAIFYIHLLVCISHVFAVFIWCGSWRQASSWIHSYSLNHSNNKIIPIIHIPTPFLQTSSFTLSFNLIPLLRCLSKSIQCKCIAMDTMGYPSMEIPNDIQWNMHPDMMQIYLIYLCGCLRGCIRLKSCNLPMLPGMGIVFFLNSDKYLFLCCDNNLFIVCCFCVYLLFVFIVIAL